MTPRAPRSERKETDQSLAVERAKADDALAQLAVTELKADVIVARARDEADKVLTVTRDKADENLAHTDAPPTSTIEQERSREDEVIEAERAVADEALRMERQARARMLARLLPVERDKTDRHLLTERARADDAVANRDDFLSMVAHDLRDLLSGIVSNTDLIVEQGKANPPDTVAVDAVQRIQRSAGRMNRLIEDLVDVAGIDAGKLTLITATSNACQLVNEATEIWGPAAQSKGIALERLGSTQPIPAKFDRDRLLQVLGNLITNAIKFSKPGASVGVGVEAIGGEVRFVVKDAGDGVPEEKREAIFERFWQLGENDRRGLGLGLYISKCLVEAHRGRIWVDSQVGAGSSFYFTIPC